MTDSAHTSTKLDSQTDSETQPRFMLENDGEEDQNQTTPIPPNLPVQNSPLSPQITPKSQTDDLQTTWTTPPSIQEEGKPSMRSTGMKSLKTGSNKKAVPNIPMRGRRKIPMAYGQNDGEPTKSVKSGIFSWRNILSFKSTTSSVASGRKSDLMPAFNPDETDLDAENDKDLAGAKYLETETGKILADQGLPQVKRREDFEEPKVPSNCCFQ